MLIVSGAYIVEMLIVHMLMMGSGLLYRATVWSSGLAWNTCKNALYTYLNPVDSSILDSSQMQPSVNLIPYSNMNHDMLQESPGNEQTHHTDTDNTEHTDAYVCIDINDLQD